MYTLCTPLCVAVGRGLHRDVKCKDVVAVASQHIEKATDWCQTAIKDALKRPDSGWQVPTRFSQTFCYRKPCRQRETAVVTELAI